MVHSLRERRKLRAVCRYVKAFVLQQSGDLALATRLRDEFEAGWSYMAELFRLGKEPREVVDILRAAGVSTLLAEAGVREHVLPGHTVTFLVLDRDKQITFERWRSLSTEPVNALLVGMGRRDLFPSHVAEKQIHLASIELPAIGDYLEIRTNSLSPLGKGIVLFAACGLLSGCDDKPPSSAAPSPPPPPPPAPLTAPPPTGTWPKPLTLDGVPADIGKDANGNITVTYPDSETRLTLDQVRRGEVASGGTVQANDCKDDGAGTNTGHSRRWGYWKYFQVSGVPDCARPVFVQLKRIELEAVGMGSNPPSPTRTPQGAGAPWTIDKQRGPNDPTAVGSIPNESHMIDAPGWTYPKASVGEGTLHRIVQFQTWVLCCPGRRVLGYFSWSVDLTVNVGTSDATTTAIVVPTGPDWHNYDANAAEARTFNEVVLRAFPSFCR